MLIVETVARNRRLHLVQSKLIKAIYREPGVSRKVVRKVLRSGEMEFRYSRTRQPQPQPKSGAWQAELDRSRYPSPWRRRCCWTAGASGSRRGQWAGALV